MKYGHFNDDACEYVIETPATPLPWINYLGNTEFFSLISNTGGGYSFFKDAKFRRITRYRYNSVPADMGSRNYYLSIMDGAGSGAKPIETWSATFLPSKTKLDSYQCRHGLGYTVFEATRQGIASTLTAFVPLDAHAEINRLDLTNHTNTTVVIDVTGAFEWCLWNAEDDSTNFQRNLSTGEVEVELLKDAAILYHKTEFRERRNHYAFYAVNRPAIGFDTSREEFLGKFNGWDTPQAIQDGKAHDSSAHGWSPIAAPRVRITLAPQQTESLVFVLGYIEVAKDDKWEDPNDPAAIRTINKQPAHRLFERFISVEKVDSALRELADYWKDLLSVYSVESGNDKLDRMVNIWNQYQCMATFNLSRSASYYESGMGRGMGFRDSSQDLLGVVHLIPQRARERIVDIASTQMEDGSVWHQYQPLTKRGNSDIGSGFNDDPLWLIAGVYAYLTETGDEDILDEPVPFNNLKGSEVPLLEHLRRSVNFTMTHKGPHGLPLIGRADWNDCLNLNCFSCEPDESFQTSENNDTRIAESVFIGGMFVLYAGQFLDILEHHCSYHRHTDDHVQEEIAKIRAQIDSTVTAVKTAGWDGEWFLRAYDAHSQPVGSSGNEEGRIFIEPQGMCTMAGIGLDDGKAQKALSQVNRLLTCDWGTALLSPPYDAYHIELGEISTYPPGYKENGGVFCHNNPWISIANTLVGHDDEAFAVYRRTCPAWLEARSDIRKTEPYVYCQMVAGPGAPEPGEGKNSWLTGTASWAFVNVSQYLLGIRPTLDGLLVEPHLPKEFNDIMVRRLYRGTTYQIAMHRTGEPTLTVNGKSVCGTIIPITNNEERLVNVSLTF